MIFRAVTPPFPHAVSALAERCPLAEIYILHRLTKLTLRLTIVFGLVFLIGSGTMPAATHGTPKAIVVAWDGTVPVFVNELLQQGELPHLQALIKGGVFADAVVSVFPSKTASAFASLWTGAPPRVTGISGNRVPRAPRSRHTILEGVSGFRGAPLQAEPIWAAAHQAGKKVVMTHAPLGNEMSADAVNFRGYDALVGRAGIVNARVAKTVPVAKWRNTPASAALPLEITFTIGASRLFGLFIDDPIDPRSGYDTLLISTARDTRKVQARLKPTPAGTDGRSWWSSPINITARNQRKATVYLRLFELAQDGSDFLLYFTRPASLTASEEEWLAGSSAMARAFIGNGAYELYAQEALGPIIPNGGDSTAEARYLETVLMAQRQLIELNRWALGRFTWDLFLAYTPFPDEAEHLWRGYLDQTLSSHRPEIAARLRPFLSAVYRSCDELLGVFMANRPANTILALVSDHGLEGVDKVIAINTALQRAGLLVTDVRGFVDLAQTKVIYPPINNGYFLLNTTDRKGGVVPAGERSQVVKLLSDLLLELRDGDRPVVHRIYDAASDGMMLGIGGEAGGDIYLEPVAGYDIDPRWGAPAGSDEIVNVRSPMGSHGLSPDRPSMRTLMVLNGPGVRQGRPLYKARIIDFAPTLAKLLGIPAPKQASGRVLKDALSAPSLTSPVSIE